MQVKYQAWDKQNEQMFDVCGMNFNAQGIKFVNIIGMRHIPSANSSFHPKKSNYIYAPNFELRMFTGLFDKNDNPIFSDDIVAIRFRDDNGYVWEKGIIKWHDESAAFKWFSMDDDPSDANNYWLQGTHSTTREIIGDIYRGEVTPHKESK